MNKILSDAAPILLGKATTTQIFGQGHFVRQLRASDLHLRHSPKLECGPPCLSLNVLVLVQVVVAMAWVTWRGLTLSI